MGGTLKWEDGAKTGAEGIRRITRKEEKPGLHASQQGTGFMSRTPCDVFAFRDHGAFMAVVRIQEAGVKTMAEFVRRTEDDLRRLTPIDDQAMKGIRAIIESHGLSLGMYLPDEAAMREADKRVAESAAKALDRMSRAHYNRLNRLF